MPNNLRIAAHGWRPRCRSRWQSRRRRQRRSLHPPSHGGFLRRGPEAGRFPAPRGAVSSSRSGCPPRLSQNRTCAVHIRLFGATDFPLAGSHRGRPVHGPSVPTSRETCHPPFPQSAHGVVRKRCVFMPRALGLRKSRETMTSRLPVDGDRSPSTSSTTSRRSLRPCLHGTLKLPASIVAAGAFPPLQGRPQG